MSKKYLGPIETGDLALDGVINSEIAHYNLTGNLIAIWMVAALCHKANVVFPVEVQKQFGKMALGFAKLAKNQTIGSRVPVVKIFLPDGAAKWLLTEVDPDDPDRAFGLCDLGLGYPELGWVSLTELTSLRGPLGLPVERDTNFVGRKPLSAYADEARTRGGIVA